MIKKDKFDGMSQEVKINYLYDYANNLNLDSWVERSSKYFMVYLIIACIAKMAAVVLVYNISLIFGLGYFLLWLCACFFNGKNILKMEKEYGK